MMDIAALVTNILCCPDCQTNLGRTLVCSSCGRSFAPEQDGIISALPVGMIEAVDTPEQAQRLIEQSGQGEHGKNIVLYEKAFHDEQAAYYDEMFADPQPLASYYKHLVRRQIYSYVKGQRFVVDLCCGTGKSSMPLLEQGVAIVGIDVSRRMLQLYRKKWPGKNLLLIHADASCPPLRRESCGAIIMIGGLHHIQDQEGCVTRCCDALTDDGTLILHEPVQTGKRSSLARLLENVYAAADPHRVWGALQRRIGRRGPSSNVASSGEGHLDFTPYERPFSSSAELAALMPSGIRAVDVRSQGQISFHEFPPLLQRRAAAPLARLVVRFDDYLSSRHDDGSGDALFAVFRKDVASYEKCGPAVPARKSVTSAT
jgi:ubiquinone/menaquinone biosynthesis C-methylase UbiE